MKLEKLKNAKRNMIFGIGNRMVYLLVPFINRTVVLYLLGEAYLGLNGLFSSILSVLSLTELGFGTAMVYSMYQPIVDNDQKCICALLNLYRKIYRVIGIVIVTAGAFVSLFVDQLISGDVPEGIDARIIFWIQLANIVLGYFMFAYKSSLFSAFQRQDVNSRIDMIITLLQALLQFILLVVFRNFYIYLMAEPLLTVLRNVLRYKAAGRMFPQFYCEGKLDIKVRRSIWKKTAALFFHKIGGVIANALDNIVISMYMGLRATAVYGNYMYIYSGVVSIMNIFYTSILAGIGNSIAEGNEKKNYDTFMKLNIVNLWLSGWCAICMLCLYQPFMILWAGKSLLLEFRTVILLVLYFYINMSRRMVVTYKDAAGCWERDKWKSLISGMVNAAANVFLIQRIGIDGVVLSTIFAFAVIEIPWELYALYKECFTDRKKKEYCWLQVQFAAAFLMVGMLTWVLADKITAGALLGLVGRGIVCVIVPNILMLVIFWKKLSFIKYYIRKLW